MICLRVFCCVAIFVYRISTSLQESKCVRKTFLRLFYLAGTFFFFFADRESNTEELLKKNKIRTRKNFVSPVTLAAILFSENQG